jgi:16S rRNA processing protein RimM
VHDDGDAPERAQPQHLVVGHVSKPHGTKGEIFVWPLTDRPDAVFADGHTLLVGDESGALDEETIEIEVERTRPFKRGILVKVVDREDRSAVEDLAGRYLLVPVAEIAPLEDGEHFYHDLLGIGVETVDGRKVGEVREVYETVPAHMLEVKGEDGKLHLIPFSERIVKQVDVDSRRIVIKPPPGLLEL